MADDPQLTAADPEAPPAGEPVAAMPLNVEEVLEEYRRRQMIEHMTGPMVSVIVHLVVLVVCFFFMVAPVDVTPKDYEVEIKDIQVKELQEKVQEKLQEIVKNADNTPRADGGQTGGRRRIGSLGSDQQPGLEHRPTGCLD